MYAVRGVLKDYDWGVVDGLAPWCGAETGGPQAELWFGAHPSGPSPLIDSDATLADVVPDAPLLVKLLYAAHPLSIQVHPDAAAASSGRFTDTVEKTEMLWALTRFEAFVGWRSADQAARILESYGADHEAVTDVRRGTPWLAISALLSAGPIDEHALLKAVDGAGCDAAAHDAVAAAAATFPGDPGLLVLALLDHVVLEPGDAVFVPAGVVHAYVRGLGLEVMTSSDNVLRLGLTSKQVAIEEACAVIRHDRVPEVIRQAVLAEPLGAPFSVERVPTTGLVAGGGDYRVIVAVGPSMVKADSLAVDLAMGSALVARREDPAVIVEPESQAFVVRERR